MKKLNLWFILCLFLFAGVLLSSARPIRDPNFNPNPWGQYQTFQYYNSQCWHHGTMTGFRKNKLVVFVGFGIEGPLKEINRFKREMGGARFHVGKLIKTGDNTYYCFILQTVEL